MPCSWALNTRLDKGTHTERHVGRHLWFPIVTQKDVSQVWSCPHPTLGGPPQGSDLWGSPLYPSSSSPVPHRLEIPIFAQEPSEDLSVNHHVLPFLVSAIHILVAKCTLPLQRSQWGPEEGRYLCLGSRVGVWCGDVGEG